MLNSRENAINCLTHKKVEYTPVLTMDFHVCGFGMLPGPWIEKGPMGGGIDGFGVKWAAVGVTYGGKYILDDIEAWREKVVFPDLDNYDWETDAKRDLSRYDGTKVLEYGCGSGAFERLVSLMGFEEALVAMITNPEDVTDFFKAHTDYKIKFAEKVAEYYHPDTFTNYDDFATARAMFMSPDIFRELLLPNYKRLYEAVESLGMIPVQHTCGKCEDVIPDIIEAGAKAWHSAQPSNNLQKILEKYGDRFCVIGGYDTQGRPGMTDCTDEEAVNEVKRCFEEYGRYVSYMFMGARQPKEETIEALLKANMPLNMEIMKIRNGQEIKQ